MVDEQRRRIEEQRARVDEREEERALHSVHQIFFYKHS
jgi:hypothetical protein